MDDSIRSRDRYRGPTFPVAVNARRQQRGSLGIGGASAVTFALIVAGFLLAYQFVDPAPPDSIVLATGSEGGAYQRFGKQYQSYLAERGIEVTLRETAGSVENLELLATNSDVDIAFVQGGLADAVQPDAAMAIGSLYLEPLWLFVRRDLQVQDMSDLAGARLSVGAEGSGTRFVAGRLLAAHGIKEDAAEFVALQLGEVVEAFAEGDLDAAFVIADPHAEIIGELLRSSVVRIHSPARADAYARRYPYLTRVSLPEGVLDLRANQPEENVNTVAVTAMLVARRDFHPALVDLLLVAAADIHGGHSVLAARGEFPTDQYVDLPLSPDADRHLKNGPPFLMRYLPFWTATLVDRLWVMLLPLFGLAIPLIKLVPPAYQWRVRQKFSRLYSELEELDPRRKALEGDADRASRIVSLNKLDNQTVTASVPSIYKDDLYKLRRDIDLVRRQLLDADRFKTD
jgi:TRAP transporter TAXI family solute receptor